MKPIGLLALFTLLALPLAYAQDDGSSGSAGSSEPSGSGGDLNIDDLMKDINLGPEGAANEVTYEGRLSSTAPGYVAGKNVTISHTGGTIAIRCMDAPGITARLGYTVFGTNKTNMENFGKAIGLSTGGDANGGWVRTRIPSKGSGVNRADIPLTVNLPQEARITVTGGAGWVQVIDCKGTVKSTNGDGGAYVSGTYTNVSVSAGKGDVKVELTDQSQLSGVNAVSAPGGAAVLRLPLSYMGKLMAKGSEVTVAHTVMGTNTPNLVQGTVGTGTASVSVTARDKVEITAPR